MPQEDPINTSGLSALEKAKRLKEQAAAEKQALKAKTEEERLNQERALDDKYYVSKQELDRMRAKQKDLGKDLKDSRAERYENIKTQRAAIREMVGTEEGVELFKEHKKDIFSEEEESLKNIKEKEKGYKKESSKLEEDIKEKEEEVKKDFENTTEGKEIKEKERIEKEREKMVSEIREEVENSVQDYLRKQEERYNNILKHIEGLKDSLNRESFEVYKEAVARDVDEFSNDNYYRGLSSSHYSDSMSNLLDPINEMMRKANVFRFEFEKEMSPLENLKSLTSSLMDEYNSVAGEIRRGLDEIKEENKIYNNLSVFKKLTTKKPMSEEEFFEKMNKRHKEINS